MDEELNKKEEIKIEKKITTYISEVEFNSGDKITIKENDIVVLVGANNVGKSQVLRDIYKLCEDKSETKVIKDIKVIKEFNNLKDWIKRRCIVSDNTYNKHYESLDVSFYVDDTFFENIVNEYSYSLIRNVFVTNLETEKRLTIAYPANRIAKGQAYMHPIHYAVYEDDKREWLYKCFKKAFKKEIIVNTIDGGNEVPLCIGEKKDIDEFNEKIDVEKLFSEYASILEKYDKVHEQGDGIRSFVGILLYLMIDRYRTFLIDEPEAFLHPPQANIMGKVIAESLKDNQQAFISTHSEEIIKGLLEVAPDRVKIVRIERNKVKNLDENAQEKIGKDINNVSTLENDKISNVWNDPILKYSNIMSGLFHNEVVVCESDSDCKMYSIINDYLNKKEEKYSETLFIHAGGKHRIEKIVKALKALNVKVKSIVDADIMNDENTFKNLIESFGINWNDKIRTNYKCIEANLYNQKNEINRNDLKRILDPILQGGKENLDKDELKTISEAIKKKSRWEDIKRVGVTSIPSGDATKAFSEINKILEDNKIFIVPVGEIENFIKEEGSHGPEWVSKVLETYPDINNQVYENIIKFVEKVCK